MSSKSIIRQPDSIVVDGVSASETRPGFWDGKGFSLEIKSTKSKSLKIHLSAPDRAICRITARWRMESSSPVKILGDHWERAYGDLEWRGVVPERVMPWYFMMVDEKSGFHGIGVKTNPAALCWWKHDYEGVTLGMDVRCGGEGVALGQRRLAVAIVIEHQSSTESGVFAVARAFAKKMADKPLLPKFPVYGANDWYYAYGDNSRETVLRDSRITSDLAPNPDNRPFSVIDAGWQCCRSSQGGPWHICNDKFGDMGEVAAEIKDTGCRPGLWFRPLLTSEEYPYRNMTFKKKRESNFFQGFVFDPSIPEVLERVRSDVECFVNWGFELIKHDFSSWDTLGNWGFEMGSEITHSGWSFHDKSKTTAEILGRLYKTIRDAGGDDAIIIGCNTMSHLAAGHVHLQRTGDDTSGVEWERTRKMGINTLAFRAHQHGVFYDCDADCVGLTKEIPWRLNKQWLELLAASGTPLFVSADPKALGAPQKKALSAAYAKAAKPMPLGEPLDWMETTCPTLWSLDGRQANFRWSG